MSELYQRNLSYSYGTSSSSNNASPDGNGGTGGGGGGGVSINNKSSFLLLNKPSSSNNGCSSTCSSATTNSAAIPGRPQRRRRRRTTMGRRNAYSSSSSSNYSIPMDIVLAILLWYMLGVASIATSKVLLSPPPTTTTTTTSRMPIHPLTRTLQQLTIGSIILYGLIAFRSQKLPNHNTNHSSNQQQQHQQQQDTIKSTTIITTTRSSSSSYSFVLMEIPDCISREMFRAGVCFTMGFVLTNMAFHTAAPSYVETIKAGEPITSSILAVWFRLEHITSSQGMYLTTIMVGVILSTIAQGNSHGAGGSGGGNKTTMTQALISCMIVMISNLCFSFRGLYQKLLQRKLLLLSTSSSTTTTTTNNASLPPLLDDLNLQFQMQSTGVCILLGPVLVMEMIFPYLQRHGSFSFLSSLSSPSSSWYTTIITMNGNPESWLLLIQSWIKYAMIAIPNGLAFTGYNLASTYILSRLSVVHHAALNCIRRVFAILVTSLLFQIPLSFLSASGIAVAITGFLAYTHSKANTIPMTTSSNTTTPIRTELQLLPR